MTPHLSPAYLLRQAHRTTQDWIDELELLGNKAYHLHENHTMSEVQWAEMVNIMQVAAIVKASING